MFVFTVSSSQLWTLLLSNGCRNIRPTSAQGSYRFPTLHVHKHQVPKSRMGRFIYSPNPVAARSKACVCGRSNSGIVGSNPSGSMDVCLLCYLLSGRGLCVGVITRPEEYQRVWCVWVWSCSPVRGGHDPKSGRSATGETIIYSERDCGTQDKLYLRPSLHQFET